MSETTPLLGSRATRWPVDESLPYTFRDDGLEFERPHRRNSDRVAKVRYGSESLSEDSLQTGSQNRTPSPEEPLETKLLNAKFQSLDYDNCENVLYQKEERYRSYRQVLRKQVARWVVMFLIGVVTGLIACVIDLSIRALSSLKYSLVKQYFDRCMVEGCLSVPLLIWVGLSAAAVMVASILVAYGEPVAAGSGIPQIKCFLNGIKIPHVVRIKTLICKVCGVILSVVGGLAIGKEGPMIHSGSVVAAGVSQGCSTTFRIDFKSGHTSRQAPTTSEGKMMTNATGDPTKETGMKLKRQGECIFEISDRNRGFFAKTDEMKRAPPWRRNLPRKFPVMAIFMLRDGKAPDKANYGKLR